MNQLTAIAYVRGLGTVIGAENGAFFLHDDAPDTNGWLELERSSSAFRILAITPYEDGFVFAAQLGGFGQYRRSQGYCPRIVPSADDTNFIVPHGDGFLLFPRSNDPTVRYVRATRVR